MLVLKKWSIVWRIIKASFFKSGVLSALLSSAGNVSVSSSLVAPRIAHEGMVEGRSGLDFPRARSALRHSKLKYQTKRKRSFLPHRGHVYSMNPTFKISPNLLNF